VVGAYLTNQMQTKPVFGDVEEMTAEEAAETVGKLAVGEVTTVPVEAITGNG
jgi:hypothetical protein